MSRPRRGGGGWDAGGAHEPLLEARRAGSVRAGRMPMVTVSLPPEAAAAPRASRQMMRRVARHGADVAVARGG